MTAAERNCYFALGDLLEENEYGCIGTGIGSGVNNTSKLKVLGFEEAMVSPDKDNWQASVDQEHERMLKNGVWEVVDHSNIPEGANIIDTTWAMKKMVNGGQGFQTDPRENICSSQHFISGHAWYHSLYCVGLMLMGNMIAHLVDVNGAFLFGEFKPDKKIYMKIPWGFKNFCPDGGLLFFRKDSVWCQKCSKSILVIDSQNHEQIGVQGE